MIPDRPGFAFRGPGLDRSELLRERPDELRRRWPQARVVIVDGEGHARFPHASDDAAADAMAVLHGADFAAELPTAASFLGVCPDATWFALPHESLPEPLPGRLDLRSAAAQWPAFDASVLAQARALLHWQLRNRFCGGCGAALAPAKAGWVARCGGCGLEHYPRTDPAVIVAVSDGARLLLGRQTGWPARRYSVIAGFVEPGESLEQTVAREVLEETGVRVRSCRYLGSQPWPFPGALMLGFAALAEADEPQVGDELEEARWFTLDEIRAASARGERDAAAAGERDGALEDDGPLLSPSISISRWLIDQWRLAAEADAGR